MSLAETAQFALAFPEWLAVAASSRSAPAAVDRAPERQAPMIAPVPQGEAIRFAPSELEALADPDARRCDHCGEAYYIDIAEVWPEERAFLPTACCETAIEWLVEEMREWPRPVWVAYFRQFAGVEVRQLITEPERSSHWTMDWGLTVTPVTFAEAQQFVAAHHRHNQPPCGWRWGHAIANGDTRVAVVMVGRPVAKAYDYTRVVEINRLCVDHDQEPGLVWNACSQLYGTAAREAERRGFERIITYTLDSEDGTSLRAAGFEPARDEDGAILLTEGGSWNSPSRPREDTAPTCPKIRWERTLRPTARAVRARQAIEAERRARREARKTAKAARPAGEPTSPVAPIETQLALLVA